MPDKFCNPHHSCLVQINQKGTTYNDDWPTLNINSESLKIPKDVELINEIYQQGLSASTGEGKSSAINLKLAEVPLVDVNSGNLALQIKEENLGLPVPAIQVNSAKDLYKFAKNLQTTAIHMLQKSDECSTPYYFCLSQMVEVHDKTTGQTIYKLPGHTVLKFSDGVAYLHTHFMVNTKVGVWLYGDPKLTGKIPEKYADGIVRFCLISMFIVFCAGSRCLKRY